MHLTPLTATVRTTFLLSLTAFATLGQSQTLPPPPFGALGDELSRVYTGEALTTFSLISLRNVNPVLRHRMLNARLKQSGFVKSLAWDEPGAQPLLFASTDKGVSLPSAQDTQATSPWGFFTTIAHDASTRSSEFDPLANNAIVNVGFNSRYSTLTSGGDYRLNADWLLGGALTVGRARALLGDVSNSVIKRSAGDIDANVTELSSYATWSKNGWYVDSYLTLAHLQFDTARNVLLGSDVRVAQGSTSGRQVSAGVSGGYDWRSGPHTVSPHMRVEGLKLNIDGYSETGSGGYDAQIGKQTRDSLHAVVGLRYTQSMSLDIGVIVPQLTLEWIRELRGDSKGFTATPLSSTLPAIPNAPGDRLDKNFATITIGATGQFADNWSGFAQVEHYVAFAGVRKTVAKIGVQKEL